MDNWFNWLIILIVIVASSTMVGLLEAFIEKKEKKELSKPRKIALIFLNVFIIMVAAGYLGFFPNL